MMAMSLPLWMALAVLTHLAATTHSQPAAYSPLWGVSGSAFNPAGRLPDVSYAGYAANEEPIPNRPPTRNLKRDYGARGDGRANDTAALVRALNEMPDNSVLYIPAGQYIITGRVRIGKRISLKGDGSSATRLIFPRSLASLYGDVERARTKKYSSYSNNGAFITYWGNNLFPTSARLGSITAPARRGDNTLKVSSTSGVAVGEWITVAMGSPRPGSSLFTEMNLGVSPGCTDVSFCLSDDFAYTYQTRVAAKPDSTTLILERPLPWNLYSHFTPKAIYRWQPRLANIGVEGISFEFPTAAPYHDHFNETGVSALEMVRVTNSFVRDVQTVNCDICINIRLSAFVTVTGVTVRSTPGRVGRGGTAGHYGVVVGDSSDVAVSGVTLFTRMEHDLSVGKFNTHLVYSACQGVDLNLDHHRAQPFAAVFTQINFGASTRPLKSSGAGQRGMHAGQLFTYWNLDILPNVRAAPVVPPDYGPGLNFVDVSGLKLPASLTSPAARTWVVQNITVNPPNLYDAQRAVRLAGGRRVAPELGGKGNGGRPLSAY